MSLRLRLALAFLLLSALPLAGFALYSYRSSSAALRHAAEAEARGLARDLEERVDWAAYEVDKGIRVLARLPLEAWTGTADAAGAARLEGALAFVGPALEFVEGFSFVPRPPSARVPGPPGPPAVPPTPAVAPVAAVAPTPAVGDGSHVVVRHGGPASRSFPVAALEPAQREALGRELETLRAEVARTLAATRAARDPSAQVEGLQRALALGQEAFRQLGERTAGAPAAATPLPEPAGGAIPESVTCEVEAGDEVVGRLEARVRARELLRSVLAQTDRERGDIPFALDEEGQLHAARAEDAALLGQLPALRRAAEGTPWARADGDGDWVVVTRRAPDGGFTYGIARPLSRAMSELKRATARNFTFGMALVGLALVGMVPLSGRLVRNVSRLEQGAARIAEGHLAARVPVTSRDELGRLAATFNRMAEQLAENQGRLLEQERLRKEEEIARCLLAAENERRRGELAEARDFQLSLLPRELPRRAGLRVAVSMTTATEVGGDYYDFLDGAAGELVVAVGDATGHGAAAGTMVTAVKGLFAGGAAESAPAAFLRAANAAVHRMGLVRRAMALTVARVDGRRVTLSAAGMPPVLHYRAATGAVEELALPGTPLGARADFPYAQATLELAASDALLFLSDGLPELPGASGEPFGYERLARRFGELAPGGAEATVAGLTSLVAEWSGDRAPADDVTFLVLEAV